MDFYHKCRLIANPEFKDTLGIEYTALIRKKVVSPFLPKLVNTEVWSYSSFLFTTAAGMDSYISILFITAVVINKKLE